MKILGRATRGRCIFVMGVSDMVSASSLLSALLRNKSGVTAIEYGLIAGAIAVAIIATVIALGGDIANLFGSTGNSIGSMSSTL